ncbi:MAG: preprotein translocase subunit YajC [Candidatus Schekmanbacteria bacterium RBG_13_48_7]|uniref:Preprotein translocase subunit YajC n=1 Tax=Candidatus Schekmanbacteria bacterium RBG_13_48_7 TaxID=1817878 RepID=A0A1F7RQ93_9BACT|nr:MAG: preprotein translocase subunit YajC [Candidatus Schekmanbacteria bacterium RBG_13_48_7]
MFQDNLLFFLKASPEQGSGNALVQFLPIIAIFFVFYFLLIRPQQKKQKDVQLVRENLKKGDKVITSGGIYGQVVGIDQQSIMLKVDEKTKIQVLKAAIAGKQESDTDKIDLEKP